MNRHKNWIPLETWAILENSYFWPLIKPFFVDIMTEEQITKKQIDIELIIRHYEKDTKEFKFGKVVKKITPDDVNKILGLPSSGKEFTFNKKEAKEKNDLITKHFGKCKDALIDKNPSGQCTTRGAQRPQQYQPTTCGIPPTYNSWKKGLNKHNKEKPITLSGCLILILYWFLENTKVRRCIAGR